MKRSWIKLYLDVTEDPQMARLPDPLWRCAIELFIMAGRNGDDGSLQPVDELAWHLRTSEEQLIEQLRALAKARIVHEAAPGQWVVTDFAKQQPPVVSTERVREFRKRNETRRNADETAAAADETSDSYSSSASDSQGEEVQEEGDETPARKRHRPRSPSGAAARGEFELNAGLREAERLLLRVSRLAALPPGEAPRLEQTAALLTRYGPEAAGRQLAAQLERWVQTVSEKTGKPYSPLNFAWVDWADAVLAGHAPPGAEPVREETPAFDREAYEAVEREAVPPPPDYAERLARMQAELRAGAGGSP